MGDRCNIRIKQNGPDGAGYVYFYGHWAGHHYAEALQSALAKRWRWDDEPYLARIIFNELQGDDRGETGFGITTYQTDNEHPVLTVDAEKRTVTVEPHRGREGRTWLFAEYLALESPGEAVHRPRGLE